MIRVVDVKVTFTTSVKMGCLPVEIPFPFVRDTRENRVPHGETAQRENGILVVRDS